MTYPHAAMSGSSAKTSPSVFERHPRATVIGLLLVLLPITDLAFTRVYARFRPQFYRNQSLFRVRHDVYHHGFRPNVSVDLEYWGHLGASYRTNSLGFRDRVVRDVPLTSSRRRIVFIGDSFTEGIGIPYATTFVGIVEEALSPRGIEVLNAGAASYTPIIDYRKTRHLVEGVGLRFDELVVFVDIGDIQDEVTYGLDESGNVAFKQNRWLREDRANWYQGKPPWLASFGAYRFLRKNALLGGTVYEALLTAFTQGPRRAAQWTVDAGAFEAYGREGLEKAQAHMDLLADFATQHGIRLSVAAYPWPDQILLGDRDSKQVVVWRAWAERRGAGFINCFPPFFEGNPEEKVRREFIRGDIHWNEEGHRRIAEVVLAYLGGREGAGP